MYRRTACVILTSALLIVSAGNTALGQPPAPPVDAAPPAKATFWEILWSGGPFGQTITGLIILLSVAAVALVIENLVTLRARVLVPQGLADQVKSLLLSGQAAKADEQCRSSPSVLSTVLRTGISELEGGWSAVEKAMEDSLADQASRLARKVEYLSVIGNIAPMLGLLGTVFGMVLAFREVAATQGMARAADLADGIYQALITTVAGLVVAIPSLAAFAWFRSRVDQLVAETAYSAQQVFTPLKHRRRRKHAAEEHTA